MLLIFYIRTPLATTTVQASTIKFVCMKFKIRAMHKKIKSRLRNVHAGYVLYRALVIHTMEEDVHIMLQYRVKEYGQLCVISGNNLTGRRK